MAQHQPPEASFSPSYRNLIVTSFNADRTASRQILDRDTQDHVVSGQRSSACGVARCTMEIKHLCEELCVQRFWAADFVARFPEHRQEFEAFEMIPALPPGIREASSSRPSPDRGPSFPDGSKSLIHSTSTCVESRTTDKASSLEGSHLSSDAGELPASPASRAELIPDLLTFENTDTVNVMTQYTAPAFHATNSSSRGPNPGNSMVSHIPVNHAQSARLVERDGEPKRNMTFSLPFEAIPGVPLIFSTQHAAGAFGDPAKSRTVIIGNLPRAVELGHVLKQVRCGRVVRALLLNVAGIAGMEDAAAMIHFDTPEGAQKFVALTAGRPFGFTNSDGHRVRASVVSSQVTSAPCSPAVRQYLKDGHTRCLLIRQAKNSLLQKALRALCVGRPLNAIVADIQVVDYQAVCIAFTSIETANNFFRILIDFEIREASIHAQVCHVDDPCSSHVFNKSEEPFINCTPLKNNLDELMLSPSAIQSNVETEATIIKPPGVGDKCSAGFREEDLREIFKSAGLAWPESRPREAHADRKYSDKWPYWDGINREGKSCRFQRDPLSGAVQFRLWIGDELTEPSMYIEEAYKEWLYYNLNSEDPYTQESLDLYFNAQGLPNLRKLDQYVKTRETSHEDENPVQAAISQSGLIDL